MRYRLVAVCAFYARRLQSRVEQSAKASNVLARIEGRGSRQPGLLCFLSIKLSEPGSDLLAGGDGLGRELDGFVTIGGLNRNWFAPFARDEQRLERARLPHDGRQRPDHCRRGALFDQSRECCWIHGESLFVRS
ncbi:hypothetical protein ASG57_27460 [Bradyrhizobium sp. Leaf396]|nr:hypothetical protein ASG57_27460 [Bradyrhizobium sp. Leaf396]